MLDELLVKSAIDFANSEIDAYGLPTRDHFDLSMSKAVEIAEELGADVSMVKVGVCLMDIKLGQAAAEKRQAEHVSMSVDAGREFLERFEISKEAADKIINCIEAHHGAVPFSSQESEIVANADCYRFIHPRGVIHFIGTLTKRGLSIDEVISGAEAKLDEKKSILSLDCCRQQLDPFYESFKRLFSAGKSR